MRAKVCGQLLEGVSVIETYGSPQAMVDAVICEYEKVAEGTLYVAVSRWHRSAQHVIDGHCHIDEAVKRGSKVIVCERLPDELISSICYVLVEDSSEALGKIAANFFDHPTKRLRLVGVTGTNGKTTITTSLFHLFRALGHSVGLISTIQNRINEKSIATNRTTPDVLTLNTLFREMVDTGCHYCFMEVSSHGVSQNRIAGLHFSGAVFSNLTPDHLDYHRDMQDYAYAKKRFFDGLSAESFALCNADDPMGEFMLSDCAAKQYRYALDKSADYCCFVLNNSISGLRLRLESGEVSCGMRGIFNAYNLLACFGVASLFGENEGLLAAIAALPPVAGRFELFCSTSGIVGIVDFAHTPDALRQTLSTIVATKKRRAKVITVFGCGGERDQEKRPVMGRIAAENSNWVILTADNPRSEQPERIIEAIKQGIPEAYRKNLLEIVDRNQAIAQACSLARPDDIVLVAGKGHECYQEIDGNRLPFSDKEVLKRHIEAISKNGPLALP